MARPGFCLSGGSEIFCWARTACFFLVRVGFAQLCSLSCTFGSLVGLSPFLLERHEKKCFVQLARLIVLFPVVLAQLVVGVGLCT